VRGLRVRAVLCCCSIGLLGRSARAETPAPGPPTITSLRYTEDYSYLRDPKNRSGAWWEPLKFIPVDSAGWAYLTLGDEARLRFEHYTNNEFGTATPPNESYLRYRHLPYADLHLGSHFRTFFQLQLAWGTREMPNPFIDQTGFDIVQAFLELTLPVGSDGRLTVRGGRQVLIYGSGRLINAGPNIRTSFAGGVASLDVGGWRLDALLVRPVKPELAWFDDHADSTRLLWGLYVARTLSQKPHQGFDLFYIGFENTAAVFNQGMGRELRHTFGTRPFYSGHGWFVELESHFQTGTFSGSRITAWLVGLQSRYTFRYTPLQPWLGMRADIFSGDRNPQQPGLQTYNAMFPEGGYFGESGVIGPGNLIGIHPAIGADFGHGVTAYTAIAFYWRESLDDGTYGIGGNVVRADMGSRSRYITTQIDVAAGWAATPTLSLYAAYSFLAPGQFIADTGPAPDVQFVGAHIQLRF